MSKRFLITEDERNNILSLYTKKGIILEQDTTSGLVDTGESNNNSERIFKTPYFAEGSRKIKMSNNRLSVINPNLNNTPPKININGNHTEFNVDLTTGGINNVTFMSNRTFVKRMGGFGSINVNNERPTNTNGNFQVIMINYENSGADVSVVVGEPALCTIRISARLISLFTKDSSYRSKSDSSSIDLTQYYVPKNENEWELIKENLYDVNGNYENLTFREFRKMNYAIFLDPAWPDTALGEVDVDIPPPPGVVSIEIKLEITDPFIFDSTELTTTGTEKLNDFITEINNVKLKYGEKTYNEYIQFLKTSGITVTTSSSIDEDPNGITADSNNQSTKTLLSCREPGGITRKEYNKCLSEKRAEVIITTLNGRLTDLSGSFIPNPIGETDQFDLGAKWPEVKDNKLTAKNRILDIKLPYFSKSEVTKPTN